MIVLTYVLVGHIVTPTHTNTHARQRAHHHGRPDRPPSMLTSRAVVLTSLIGFVANAAMFSVPFHLSTFLQIVEG
ncbi:hypothetical protein [Streptomyces sp. AcE210]|uniref:hypothetical protein n=1 Tax=Streptomyces sp. AcE210 TaxID=2292703 RepID=UPI000E3081C5|nr:hypothetical protein [Streptomyces sp. AcE210]RFC77837.1 hypothetical protein DXZ75_08335 [Streptomyces sp. AcE210]